jgi:hypothetical protein
MLVDIEKVAAELKVGRYQHYKGQFYQVLATARHSETREWVVVYRCLYDDFSIWVRPLEMFVENVTLDNGQHVARFAYIAEMGADII